MPYWFVPLHQVTAIFLIPIQNVLRVGDLVPPSHLLHSQSSAYKRLQRTKWTVLLGTFIALVSSTLLYINGFLYFISNFWLNGDQFKNDPNLNVYVLGGNLDSILNDLGTLNCSRLYFASFPTFMEFILLKQECFWYLASVMDGLV
jgi:hypothetical protein